MLELDSVKSYKLDRCDKESEFIPISLFCPFAGQRKHSCGVATSFSGGKELHVLSTFLSHDAVVQELKEFLATKQRYLLHA